VPNQLLALDIARSTDCQSGTKHIVRETAIADMWPDIDENTPVIGELRPKLGEDASNPLGIILFIDAVVEFLSLGCVWWGRDNTPNPTIGKPWDKLLTTALIDVVR
jgi:hypothetical protein